LRPLTRDIYHIIISKGYGVQRLRKEFNISERTARDWIAISKYFDSHNMPFLTDPLLQPKTHIDYKIEGNHFKVASIADWHIGSKMFKKEAFQTFIKYAIDQGVEIFLAPGDLIDANNVYRGQEYELAVVGIDDQVDLLCETVPVFANIKFFFITGNHEYTAYKMVGKNVGSDIANSRKDFTFLGAIDGKVSINGIPFDLFHGAGKGAYAVSYKIQKRIESYVPGEKPRILLVGHWHQSMEFTTRNITAYHSGSFQGPTILSKQFCLPTINGGWIIDILAENSEVKSIKSEFIFFY
jgi:predicted phosphodiesterase